VTRVQYELECILLSQLSAVQVKFLSDTDGVERWTKQSLWDGVLGNVRVVVSTYQILLDALTHAFVKMDQLALIVFDESTFSPASESVAREVTIKSA